MPDLYLRRTMGGFVPDSEADQDRVKRFKLGEVVKAKVSKPRNYLHHKKLFALLRFVAENSEVYNTERKVLTVLKILTGHVDFIADPRTGELVAQPDSISFEAMDQIEFSEWYEKAVNATCQHLVKHMTRMDLEQALEMVAVW